MLGLEVEGVQKIGGEFDGIVVAQVLSRDRHPNADKLSLCRVQDGRGEQPDCLRRPEFQGGRQSPAHPSGHALPAKAGQAPFTIKGRQDSRR